MRNAPVITSSTAFQFLYITLAVKIDDHGPSNTACHEYLAKKIKVTW